MGLTREQIIAEAKRRGLVDEEKKPSSIGRSLAQGARHIAAAIGDSADLLPSPTYIAGNLARYGMEYGAHALGYKKEKPTFGSVMPELGQKIAHGIDTLTGGYTKPTTPEERRSEAVIRPLAQLPIDYMTGTALMKVPAKLAQYAGKGLKYISKPTLGNVGATAGAGLATHQYHENVGESATPWGALTAGTLGSLAGGAGTTALRNLPGALKRHPYDTFAKGVGTATHFTPELHERGKRLGLAPSLGIASSSKIPTGLELILSKNPASGHTIDKVIAQREGQLAKHLGIHEPDLAAAVEAPAHFLAKEGAQRYKKIEGEKFEKNMKAFEPLEKELHEKHRQIDVNDVLKSIEDRYMHGRHTESEKERFYKSFAGKIYKDLETSIEEEGAKSHHLVNKLVADAKKQGVKEDVIRAALEKELGITGAVKEGASFRTLRDLEEEAFEQMNLTRPGTPKHREATIVHNLLKDKVVDYIHTHGTPEEAQAFKRANAGYSEFASKNQSNMKRYVYNLTGTDDDTAAFSKLTKNPKFLESASRELDKTEKKDMAQAIMATVGKNQGRFNISTAHSKVENWSPEVRKKYAKLLGSPKAEEDFTDALHFVTQNKYDIARIGNASSSGHMKSMIERYLEWAKSLGAIVPAAVGVGTGHALNALAYVAVKDIIALGTSKMWTDPVFLDRVNKVMKAKNTQSQFNHLHLLLKAPTVKQMLMAAAKAAVPKHEYHD